LITYLTTAADLCGCGCHRRERVLAAAERR